MPITIVAGFTRFTGFALRAILAPSSATAGLLASGVDRAELAGRLRLDFGWYADGSW